MVENLNEMDSYTYGSCRLDYISCFMLLHCNLFTRLINADMFATLQEGSGQAESNLMFLMMLMEPCEKLAEAKPSQIPALIPNILNTIRMIWMNSPYYRTREKVTGILKKVGFSLKKLFIYLSL